MVGLNALFLDPGRSGGTETYLRELAPALAREFPSTHFTVIATRQGAASLRGDGWTDFAGVEALPVSDGHRIRRAAAEQILLPRLAARRGWDVLHSLSSVAPIRAGTRSVITLHDVTFFTTRTFGATTTLGLRQIVGRAAARADALITGSAWARDEICRVLGLDAGRFVVVPHGPGRTNSVAPTPEQEVRDRYALGDATLLLTVAAKRPHKNQEVVIRALPLLSDDLVLLLAGHPEPYDARLRALAEELGVAGRIRFADYVPDEDLEGLWRLADAAVLPTLAEGFGLPVLEAMSRGVPVACSDIPVLREVGGDVPEYFDPYDPAAAATAITRARGRPDARSAGRERAALFTWRRAAEGTFEAYERANARS